MTPEGPGQWTQEIVRLGDAQGVTVLRDFTDEGQASFEVAGGEVSALVYKARTPDVTLDGAAVYLVQRLADTWQPGQPYECVDQYALMVDDPYWGRRIQPAEFGAAPSDETFVMGYRVKGRILHNGEAAVGANVSLEGVTDGVGGPGTFWDSQEYNELVWSDALETYVEGATVYAPIMTDETGRWSFICPKGHGGIYQRDGDRRDGTSATAGETLPRRLTQLAAVYLGRRAALTEEVEAVIDVLSGRLTVSGEPGAWVKVGSLDESGENVLIQEDGTATIEGLPAGEHGLVQFRLNGWGEWDSSWGCARQVVEVTEGETATADMGPLEYFDPSGNVIAGRVYERMGVPAAGLAIVPINFETGEVLESVTSTGGDGSWEIEIPEEGLGGDPWIYDAHWGCVPLLGYPYSDVVLGARAYSGFAEMYKPEAWRKGERGHANFQYVPDGVWVQDNATDAVFATVEARHGGWVTEETLPKFRFVGDVNELLATGPQLREYSLHTPREVLVGQFFLESQSFEQYETLPGQYRAAGYYPEAKFLLGGKVHGGVVTDCKAEIKLTLPEAYRIGLEFGAHEWFTQVTETTGTTRRACFADLVCPYCGGPTWRDPSNGARERGHCVQCADVFGVAEAMDARTHFRTPTIAPSASEGAGAKALMGLVAPSGGGSRKYPVKYHWRPDLYDENDDYLTQSGRGQVTNAPRWFAKHVNEVGDGRGFGRFDSAASPPFTAGHDLAWFGQLPDVQRELGLAQMKLLFPEGYEQDEDVTVELTCRLADGSTEAVRVRIPAGTCGPRESDALGDIIRLKTVGKWVAETKGTPYRGAGLYEAVTAARVVEPLDAACEFVIVNDCGLLASASGVPVEERKATPAALQLGVAATSGPHLMDDAVGQIFLFYAREGDIWMRRRAGLPAGWQEAMRVSSDGASKEPCAEKDETGRLRLFWQSGEGTVAQVSVDDGERWVEV